MPLPHFRAGLGTVLTLALLCPAALAVSAPKPDPSDRERDRASMGSSRDPATRAPVRVTPARSHGPLGIDVSNWQKTVDWKGLRSQGKRFAYIKATEGTSYRSPRFSSQYNGSYAAATSGAPTTTPTRPGSRAGGRRTTSSTMVVAGPVTIRRCPGCSTSSTAGRRCATAAARPAWSAGSPRS